MSSSTFRAHRIDALIRSERARAPSSLAGKILESDIARIAMAMERDLELDMPLTGDVIRNQLSVYTHPGSTAAVISTPKLSPEISGSAKLEKANILAHAKMEKKQAAARTTALAELPPDIAARVAQMSPAQKLDFANDREAKRPTRKDEKAARATNRAPVTLRLPSVAEIEAEIKEKSQDDLYNDLVLGKSGKI